MLIIYFAGTFAIAIANYFIANKRISILFNLIFLVLQIGVNIHAFFNYHSEEINYFRYDAIGLLCLSILTIISLGTFYHSYFYHKRNKQSFQQERAYYSALMILIVCMTGVYLADHAAILWAFIEGTTLTVAMLIYHERTNTALEATWKYIFICSIGIAFAFAGVLFLAMASHDAGIEVLSISRLVAEAAKLDPIWLKIAFVLTLIGFSAKLGVFPFYTVGIGAQMVAPFPINALFATTLKNTGFVGVYRVFSIVTHSEAINWSENVLILVGLVSLLVAAAQLSIVANISRALAYSSLEHMGLICLGLAVGGLGYYTVIFHLVLHSFAKSGFFFQTGQIFQQYQTFQLEKMGNYFKQNPMGGLVVIFAFLCLMALPPSGLFITEIMLFRAIFERGQTAVGIIALILLTVILYNLTKRIFAILYANENQVVDNQTILIAPNFRKREAFSQVLLLGLVVYLGFNPPDFFVRLLVEAARVLQ
ncbi:MAG: hydrogenase 4 subunit F [Flammeovirgaceae bacterium]